MRKTYADGLAKFVSAATTARDSRPSHSITRLARSMMDGGIEIFSAFAVFRLTTSSNSFGCSTGMSPAFAPLRMLTFSLLTRPAT